MTGGGFGSCIVTLVHSDCADAVREDSGSYESEQGQGSSFASRLALGAHLIKSAMT